MGVKWDFGKSAGVDPVASSRFPEAAERAHQGRDNRNSGPGLRAVWHSLAGDLGKVLTLGFGPAES